MSEAQSIPQKPFYRANEVCQFTDTQPYVLRFWESEFPQLAPDLSPGGQPVYRKKDIDLVLRIKELLYDGEYTIAAARKQLDRESGGKRPSRPPRKQAARRQTQPPRAETSPRPPREPSEPVAAPAAGATFDNVPRERYEDAVDEIAHLRLMLNEGEANLRRTESALRKAEDEAAHRRQRVDATIARLETLLERLTV